MTFDVLFFDLDGTITDSMPGITRSVRYALEHYGIQVAPEELRMFLGPPLRESFQKYFPETISENNVDEAIGFFRERYSLLGVHELTVYPGIPELLQSLKTAGRKLALATSKGENFARQILAETNLERYFSCISGADYASGRLAKGPVLRHAYEAIGQPALDTCLMIGDREHDIHGAHEVGMPCAAVLYGYGNRQEFAAAGADFIIENTAALKNLLLR